MPNLVAPALDLKRVSWQLLQDSHSVCCLCGNDTIAISPVFRRNTIQIEHIVLGFGTDICIWPDIALLQRLVPIDLVASPVARKFGESFSGILQQAKLGHRRIVQLVPLQRKPMRLRTSNRFGSQACLNNPHPEAHCEHQLNDTATYGHTDITKCNIW